MRTVAIASLWFAHAAMAGVVVQSVSIQGTATASSGYQLFFDEDTFSTVPYSETKDFSLDTAGVKLVLAKGNPSGFSVPPGAVVFYGPDTMATAGTSLDLSHGIDFAGVATVQIGSGFLDGIVPQAQSSLSAQINFEITNSPGLFSFNEPTQTVDGIPYAPSFSLNDQFGAIITDQTQSTNISNLVLGPGSYQFNLYLSPFLVASGGMLQSGSNEGYLRVVPEASSLILAGLPLIGLFLWKRGDR